MTNPLSDFKGKKVLITGHTGFKGSWLTLWMIYLGAKVIGISNSSFANSSVFKKKKIKKKIIHKINDVRNLKNLTTIINRNKPDFIFHLAAQSLVKESYRKTKYTFETNALGTLNILEALKKYNSKKLCSVVLITSDKSYRNLELDRGYKEEDILGGNDPYSASKACAEIIIKSYFKSFLENKNNIKISVARAGNVIGGGDWSKDRLIPDCIKSIILKKKLLIRFPKSTRPWQYVLEPLFGYMMLALKQKKILNLNGEAFNFGPNNKNSVSVIKLIKMIKKYFKNLKWKIVKSKKYIYESKLLKLNSLKAKRLLNWKCILTTEQTIKMVIDWYAAYLNKNKLDLYDFSMNQIIEYERLIKSKKK